MVRKKKNSVKKHDDLKTVSKVKAQDIGDATIVLVFLAILFFIIFAFGDIDTSDSNTPDRKSDTVAVKTSSPYEDQEVLLSKLVTENQEENDKAIIVGDVIAVDTLDRLAKSDYDQLKRDLDVESDFFIYFEDEDGNLVEVIDRPCIGTGYVSINGQKCDE